MKEFTKKHIGKRMLIRKTYSSYENVDEVIIKELSPSGNRIKVQWISDRCSWIVCEDYEIVEILNHLTEIGDSL